MIVIVTVVVVVTVIVTVIVTVTVTVETTVMTTVMTTVEVEVRWSSWTRESPSASRSWVVAVAGSSPAGSWEAQQPSA